MSMQPDPDLNPGDEAEPGTPGAGEDICEACAQECAKHPLGHCQDCAKACRRCAEECRRCERACREMTRHIERE